MQPECKSYRHVNRNVNRKTGTTALFILTDQVIAVSQNKWKEGWIKSAENWKQIWINLALKFKCSAKWLKINVSQGDEFQKLQRFSSKVVQRIRVSVAHDSLKLQNKNYEWLVFEQGNDPVIQWLSCIIIQKLIILLKVNIEVKCVYNLKELKHLNANAM